MGGMTSTGTYAFNPAASNLTLMAFSRVGIKQTEITAQHMYVADSEANLVQVELSNRQPNLWTSTLQSVTLTDGTASYDLPPQLIAIQAAYITTTSGSVSTDRIIWPLSAFEYAAMPNKAQQGPPTAYWLNMQISPTITLWPVPDDAATYTLNIRAVNQIQDASLRSGATLNLPFRFLDVWVAGLALRLARHFARDQEMIRKADYKDAWDVALMQDQEQVPIYITPGGISSYWG